MQTHVAARPSSRSPATADKTVGRPGRVEPTDYVEKKWKRPGMRSAWKRERAASQLRGGGGGYTTSEYEVAIYETEKKSRLSKHCRAVHLRGPLLGLHGTDL